MIDLILLCKGNLKIKIMKKILILSIILLSNVFVHSQIVNSQKNTIGEFYDADVKRVELNGAKVSSQIRLRSFSKAYIFSVHPDSAKTRSALKHNTFYLNFGITNTSSFLNLNKFNFKENNGFTFGFTFQHSFNEIYLSSDSMKYNPVSLWAFTTSIDYTRDKFKNYDPSSLSISTVNPNTLTLSGGVSRYKFHYRETAKFKFSWVPSIHSSINLLGYNKKDLNNYLLEGNTNVENGVVFTNNSSFDGKYGTLRNDIKSVQLSFSVPFVPEKIYKALPIISPIPYISVIAQDRSRPTLTTGFALGFLSSSLFGKESEEKAGGVYRGFNVPSFLTIGVDWSYNNLKWTSPNYFISGSIKLK